MKFFTRIAAGTAALWLCTAAVAQTQSDLISKNIPLIFGVKDKFIAFNEYGKSYSYLDLFANPVGVKNHDWPYPGYVQDGAVWRTSLLLRSDSVSDSAHVGRLAGLLYDGKTWKTSDSLVMPFEGTNTLSHSAGFTAMAVWHDTAILAFGKLGIGYAPLAPEESLSLLTSDTIRFSSFPSQMTGDTVLPMRPCVWNQVCKVDSLPVPATGLDSIYALAVDSSAPDSVWLLVSAKSGLRRGLLGGKKFPRAAGISDSDIVKNIYTSPGRSLLWAFTDTRFFFSGDHGRSFKVPDSIPGLQTEPSQLKGYAFTPQATSFGDTTFVSFNLTKPGLVLFKGGSLQQINPGSGEISDVLLSSDDSLDITATDGSLTSLAVANGAGGQAILALGSDTKGIFYRRLDLPGHGFINKNRLRAIKSSLSQVITFPTLFGSEVVNGVPKPVHIGYSLKKSGNVTITVYNYAMEKVRTVVKSRPRLGGVARSENSGEDVWDGKDGSGRYVSVGTYYILVESDQGEKGFGKAMSLWGER